jgi:hypothetical protein
MNRSGITKLRTEKRMAQTGFTRGEMWLLQLVVLLSLGDG